MDNQENCLNKLIKSSQKKDTSFPMGMEKIGLNLYRNQSNNILILIGAFNEEAKYKYLNDYDAVSEEELFLRFFIGCTGPSSIGQMLQSFSEYNNESVPNNTTDLLKSLKANKMIICYSDSYGASTAALVMIYKILQNISIDCVPIIIKPASFTGKVRFERYFTDLLTFIDTSTYHIYDENLCINKLGTATTMNEFKNTCELNLLETASSIMEP